MTLAGRTGGKKGGARPGRRNSRYSSNDVFLQSPDQVRGGRGKGRGEAQQLRIAAGRPPEEGGPIAKPDPASLLSWFDRHRRVLPWRAPPGEAADPYRVWLSEILLQQTTVKAVVPYYQRFVAQFPSVEALAQADLEDVLKLWAGLGYYARARNLHACAAAVAARGSFPDREDELRQLPGIGPYTAAAIAAIAFDRQASPVDGNVERVVARLFAVGQALPNVKPAIRKLAADLYPARRGGDFAQALMDLGATVCTPKAPACGRCPFAASCAAHARGDAEAFPRRRKKRAGRLRRGVAFVAIRADGHVLVRRRAPTGLLGGMTEVPTTEWSTDFAVADAVADAPRFPPPRAARMRGATLKASPKVSSTVSPKVSWHRVPGVVTHAFTHFPLELVVLRADLPQSAVAPDGMRWIDGAAIAGAALPSVMRKVLAHALAE